MEPKDQKISLLLPVGSDKNEIRILSFDVSPPKIIASFNPQHIAKISSLVPIYSESQTLQTIITFSYDKQVKLWHFLAPNSISLKHQCSTPKKITKAFLGSNDLVYFCDKYGDIYNFSPLALSPQEVKFEAEQTMGNLATIKIFQTIKFDKKEYLLISDEYFRIKICRFPEIYEIIAIWIPFEYMAKSIVVLKGGVLILFRSEEKKYRVSWLKKENIENTEFKGEEIGFPERNLEDFQEEKREIFLVGENEKIIIGILQQTIEKDRTFVEIILCHFDEKSLRLNEFKRSSFENRDCVKILRVEPKQLLLTRKSYGDKEEMERTEVTKNVTIFEERNLYLLSVDLN